MTGGEVPQGAIFVPARPIPAWLGSYAPTRVLTMREGLSYTKGHTLVLPRSA